MKHECLCDDHAAHLRDHAKCLDKTAQNFADIGDDDTAQHYRDGAANCRSMADEIDAWREWLSITPKGG